MTTRLYVPAAALGPTVIVNVDEPEPGAAIADGLKLAETPVGIPAPESEMEELKVPTVVVAIAAVPALPCTIESPDGDEEIAKSLTEPDVDTSSAKSSTTNEVCKPVFSVPVR